MEASRLMKIVFQTVFPQVEYRKKAPDGIIEEQRLVATEELFRVLLWGFLNIWEFISQELGQTESWGAHKPGWHALPPGAPDPLGHLVGLLVLSRSFHGLLFSKKNIEKFCRVWTSVGMDFMWNKNMQKKGTDTGLYINRLVYK